MTRLRLTDTWLKANQAQGDYADAIVPGLQVRVLKSGAKNFSVVRKLSGKTVRVRIGRYPAVSLGEARRRADHIVTRETLPVNAADRGRVAADVTAASLQTFILDYLEDYRERGRKSHERVQNALLSGKHALVPFMVERYGAMPKASEIGIEDLQAWLADTWKRSPGYVIHLRSYASTAWKWAAKHLYDYRGRSRDYGITTNPVESLPIPARGRPGDRFLSRDELRLLWNALDDHHPTHRALKLLISMGGIRVQEAVSSRAEDWRDGWLTLPETKNGRAHRLPITRHASAVLAMCDAKRDPESPYLFSQPLDPSQATTIAAMSKAVTRLQARLKLPPWTPRDLRRTMKTHLAEAGVDEHWLDVWHNHGQTAGVARKHYIRAEYEQLKRDVARQIDALLDEVLAPAPRDDGLARPSNVIRLVR